MKIVKLDRTQREDKQTLGVMLHESKTLCYTLELPWLDNQKGISCIPEGEYEVVSRKTPSSQFKYKHYHILDVPDRSWILIHGGNYHTQIKGCILVGSEWEDLNGDGYMDVVNSRKTLESLTDFLGESFRLKISNCF
jgi:hypothetical protein